MKPARRHWGVAVTSAAVLAAAVWLRSGHGPVASSSAGGELAEPGCASCHDPASEGPVGIHALMPCEVCHGGDPSAATVPGAHQGMVLEAGALAVVDGTCGLCHAREVERVRASPMATGRGLIAVDRWAFGELEWPDGDETFLDLLAAEPPSPAQDHLRRLCAGCHLHTRRDNRDDAIAETAGSGCGACHTGAAPEAASGTGHSTVDGHVPDERCFGCHSRSSRISLSYRGLAEVSGAAAEACVSDSLLADGRTVCRIRSDVHHVAGMECSDCHLYTELMGDGRSYGHAEDAVEIRCQTCHAPVARGRETTWWDVRDSITTSIFRLRVEWRPDDEPVRLGRRGTPVWNLRPSRSARPEGEPLPWVLHQKRDGAPLEVTPTPADLRHTLPGHERLACVSCHAASAPTCSTCHTTFDPDAEQWDFATGAMKTGAWIETHEGMDTGLPGLAVGADGRIRPAIPGMAGEIDARPAGGAHRPLKLFSVLDPHTTVRDGRSCQECHSDPGVFLDGSGTRRGARALTSAERRRVARVGSCLACHDGTETFFVTFEKALAALEPGHPAGRLQTL